MQFNDIVQFAKDIAKGMNYLHDRSIPIIHRDLKSSNLLVDQYERVKVSDFGLSRFITKILSHSVQNEPLSTQGYIPFAAPEVLRHENYSEKADVWSFGVVLWSLVTLKEPIEEIESYTQQINSKPIQMSGYIINVQPPSDKITEFQKFILNGGRLKIPSNCNPLMSKLISDTWCENALKRPSFKEIIISLESMSSFILMPM